MKTDHPTAWDDEPHVQIFLDKLRLMSYRRDLAEPLDIIEFGSLSIHGHDPRPWFKNLSGFRSYTGVDWRSGPGVDLVGLAHEFCTFEHFRRYRIVLSVSALEHDPFWSRTIETMVRCTAPGGVIAITCAGPGWAQHELDCAPAYVLPESPSSAVLSARDLNGGFFGQSPDPDSIVLMRGFYENRTIEDILGQVFRVTSMVSRVEAQYAETPHGLRTNVYIHLRKEAK
jgi:hypothetical protein